MKTRKDGRNITTTMVYDALGRVTKKTYSGITPVTPEVTFTYDDPAVPYSRGRLTKVANSLSVTEYAEYDALGRVLRSNQITDWHKFRMAYGYDLAGNLTSQVYPSGRVVTYDRDAAGRVAGVNGTKAGESPAVYLAQAAYAAHGGMTSAALVGSATYQHWNYNNRLQQTDTGIGTSVTDSSLWGLAYSYAPSANNGNVAGERMLGPSVDIARTYQYDSLNRLTGFIEPALSKTFSYDRYGNRAVTAFSPANLDPALRGWPDSLSALSTATNRFTASPYNNYDGSGNMLDPGYAANAQHWDAENRHVNSDTSASGACSARVDFDGEGRVVRNTCSPSRNWILVYNIFGEKVADYAAHGLGSSEADGVMAVQVARDLPGSWRYAFRRDANAWRRVDWDPTAFTVRLTSSPIPPDMVSPAEGPYGIRWTADQPELQMGARAYFEQNGRFNTPDEPLVDQHPEDPQSWNLYGYARNNPLRYGDPSGRAVECQGANTNDCLAAAQGSMDSQAAASRLYLDRKPEKAGFFRRVFLRQATVTRTFIGIQGDVASFRGLGQNASRMADLVTDKRVFSLSVQSTYRGEADNWGTFLTAPGARPLGGGGQSVTPNQGYYPASFIDPNPATLDIDTDAQASGIPPASFGEKAAHELLGHLRGEVVAGHKAGTRQNKQDSLDAENAVRRINLRQRGQKRTHH